jgi:hypothetical protein
MSPIRASQLGASTMTEGMWHSSAVLARSWGVLAVFVIFGLVVSGVLASEPARAVASVFCIALLIQSWIMQRRYTRSRERLAFLTLALCLPALASMWLGLNVLRFYSYTGGAPSQSYSTVVRLQGIIQSVAYGAALVVGFWAIVEISCSIAERISGKFAGRRKTWWNRQLKGTWLWGSPIGFAISALIASSLLRWLVITASVLGCLFAVIFRLTRPSDEI